jgi:hypothetical protein
MGKRFECTANIEEDANFTLSHRSLEFGALSHRKFEVWGYQRILVYV